MGSRPIEPDTRINELQAELRDLKEELGFYQHDLAFTLPADEKLIARFEGELNGKPCLVATFAIQIPAPDEPVKDAQGSISVRFMQPKYQIDPAVKQPKTANWVIRVCAPRGIDKIECWNFSLPPVVNAAISGDWGQSIADGNLEGGREQKSGSGIKPSLMTKARRFATLSGGSLFTQRKRLAVNGSKDWKRKLQPTPIKPKPVRCSIALTSAVRSFS